MSGALLDALTGAIDNMTPGRLPYASIRSRLDAATTDADRAAAVAMGVASATGWCNDLRGETMKNTGPIPALRASIGATTGVSVDKNPYLGIAPTVRFVYQALGEGAVSAPWLILAAWVKEGSGRHVIRESALLVGSEADAWALARARFCYGTMGLDAYTKFTHTPGGDNVLVDEPAQQQAAFHARVQDLQRKGYLPADIEQRIDSTFHAEQTDLGLFSVTVDDRFFPLAAVLADALFRANADGLAADGRVNVDHPVLVYARWNLGQGGFGALVDWFEQHAPTKPDGTPLTIVEWLIETKIGPHSPYASVRANFVRFNYYLTAYQPVFTGP